VGRAEALSALMMLSISLCASIAERELKLVSISKKITKKCTFFLIYDENFQLLRSGDKKSSTE
jgi:hypothetical protein